MHQIAGVESNSSLDVRSVLLSPSPSTFDVGFLIGGRQFRFETRDGVAVRGCFGQVNLETLGGWDERLDKTIFVADENGYRIVTRQEAERHNRVLHEESERRKRFPEPCLYF